MDINPAEFAIPLFHHCIPLSFATELITDVWDGITFSTIFYILRQFMVNFSVLALPGQAQRSSTSSQDSWAFNPAGY